MTLTAGSGPWSERPLGRFEDGRFIEPVWPRIRGIFARETVVDSSHAVLVWVPGSLAVYRFPADEVRMDLVEDGALRVGSRVEPDAVRVCDDGLVEVRWSAMDEWFAEAEQLFGHPRDPYHRIDVYPTPRRVRVLLDGEVLADSRRARVLYEAALPPRWYLPAADVDLERLVPSGHMTRCAYKGAASYWHVRVGDGLVEDLVWSYPDPEHDAEPVRDMYCFFSEKVDIELDGMLEGRPTTQWSPGEATGAAALRGLMGRPDA